MIIIIIKLKLLVDFQTAIKNWLALYGGSKTMFLSDYKTNLLVLLCLYNLQQMFFHCAFVCTNNLLIYKSKEKSLS